MAFDKPAVSREILSPHRSGRGGRQIDHVVIHYTWSRNIEGVIKHFQSGKPRVSAHYIIGQDGELVQMVPDNMGAWHAGSSAMNARSIGIEHCAGPGDKITPAQEAASAALLRWLAAKYSIPHKNIIPHACVKSTSCPGDLFAAYGGKGGASGAVHRAALDKWLATFVFGAGEREEVEIVDAPVPVHLSSVKPVSKTVKKSRTISGALTAFAGIIGGFFNEAIGVVMEAASQVQILAPAATVLSSLGITTERVLFVTAVTGIAVVVFARVDDAKKGANTK